MFENDDFVPLSLPFQIERQARIYRSRAMYAFASGAVRVLAKRFNDLVVLGVLLLRRFAKQRLRRAIRELERFDDRRLADIGISRSGIETAVHDGLPKRVLARPIRGDVS
jgi:Domain of unknown function (DUF1127)